VRETFEEKAGLLGEQARRKEEEFWGK